jgi:hypothetical protein
VVLLQERRRHLSGTGSEILRHLTNDEFWDEEKVVFVPTMKSGKKRISAIMLPYSAEGRGMFTENEPPLFHQRKEISQHSMWKQVDNQELLRQHAVAQTKTSERVQSYMNHGSSPDDPPILHLHSKHVLSRSVVKIPGCKNFFVTSPI